MMTDTQNGPTLARLHEFPVEALEAHTHHLLRDSTTSTRRIMAMEDMNSMMMDTVRTMVRRHKT